MKLSYLYLIIWTKSCAHFFIRYHISLNYTSAFRFCFCDVSTCVICCTCLLASKEGRTTHRATAALEAP
jgi:hypothetical protein